MSWVVLIQKFRENTKTVLLESAYFNPAGNRRTSKQLGLETEAAYRFGRGIDYGGCVAVANRAAQLIQELAGGRVVEGVIDAYPTTIKPEPIHLRVRRIHQILGTEVSAEQAKAYLEALELNVRREDEDTLIVMPPSFRGDLEREIDLIEEVARMDGYEKIPITLPTGAPSSEEKSRDFLLEKKAVEILLHHGFHEVITYSFTSPASLDFLGLDPDDPRRKHLRILNPLTEDFSVMRTSLSPGIDGDRTL